MLPTLVWRHQTALACDLRESFVDNLSFPKLTLGKEIESPSPHTHIELPECLCTVTTPFYACTESGEGLVVAELTPGGAADAAQVRRDIHSTLHLCGWHDPCGLC